MIYAKSQEFAEWKLNELIKELDEEILIRKKDFIKTLTKSIHALK